MGAFGGGDSIEIPVELITSTAEKAADEFKRSIIDAFNVGATGSKKLDDSVKKVGDGVRKAGTDAKRAGQDMAEGFSKADRSAISLSARINLIEKGFRGLSAAVGTVTKAIERGSAFDDLSGTLDDLARKAGTTGDALQNRLSRTLDDTVKKFDLFRIANESLFAGLKPEQLDVAAQAARTFGDQLGGSTLKNFEAFTDSLIRGNTRAFSRIGILVDLEKAERDYFKQMGASAKEAEKLREVLTEGERADIARAASIDALKGKLEGVAKPALDAADRLDQIRKKGSDAFDEIARGVVTNETFQESLGNLAVAINNLDLGSLAKGFAVIVDAAADAIAAVDRFTENYRNKLNSALQQTAAAQPVNNQLLGITDLLNRGAGGDTASTVAAGKQLNDIIGKATKFGAGADLAGQFAVGAFAQDIEKLRTQYEALAKSQGVYGQAALKAAGSQDKLNDEVKDAGKPTAKLAKDTETQGKETRKTSTALAEYVKRLGELGKGGKEAASDLDRFNDSVDELVETPALAAFRVEIQRAFAQAKGAEELSNRIKQIGQDAQAAKVPLSAITKEIKEQQDLIAKGGEGPGNNEGIAKAMGEAGGEGAKSFTEKFGEMLDKQFGFEKGKGIGQELAEGIISSLQQGMQLAAQAITTGIGREDAAAVGSAVGGAIGLAIGAAYSNPEAGAAIGSFVGGFVGQIAAVFGEDTAGTKARKAADKFFADMFDADRLSVIVGEQVERIKDLSFTGGITTTDGTGLGLSNLARDNPAFNGETFDDGLQAQTAQIQSSFQAVGGAFEELLGVAKDIAGQIGAVLFNNIGGSLENLQILIQTSGASFEELGDAIFDSFFNGTIGLLELQGQLLALQDLYLPGIPGQIGAVAEAAQNLQIAMADGKGSRILLDSLRDVGAEALELGRSDLPFVAQAISQAMGFGADRVSAFLEAMKVAGISSVQELVDASNAKLAALALNIQQTTQGQAATNAPVTIPDLTPATNFTPASRPSFSSGGGGGRPSGQSEAQRAASQQKRELEQLRAQVIKNLQSTDAYQAVIDKLTSKQIDGREATRLLGEQYDALFTASKNLKAAQEKLETALAGGKGKRKIGELAAEVARLTELVDQLSGKGDKDKSFGFDLSQVVATIKTLDQLGAVSRAVGISLEKNVGILVEGFLKGRLSIKDVNDEIKKTQELLGQGIPNAVGAVSEAFSNLQKGGRQGGLFSVDSFKDIFAELDELVSSRGSSGRAASIKQLTAEFDKANKALQDGILSGASVAQVGELRKQFEGTQKALADFKATSDRASFDDLRNELGKTVPEEQLDIFFKAIEDSGITGLEDLARASDEAVVGILGDLNDMGFAFASVVEPSIQAAIDKFKQAEIASQGGKDVLGAEVQLVRDFNNAVNLLPASFNNTVPAIQGLQEPLGVLSQGFDDVLFKLSQLTGERRGSVIFDVSFDGKSGKDKDLLDLLFKGVGGTDIIGDTGGSEGPGVGGGLTSQERRRFNALTKKRKSGRLSASERAEFESLRRKNKG